MQNQKTNNRLSILSESERKSIYDLPSFIKEDRTIYFSLNSTENEIIKTQLRGVDSKILFILQLGYFRASFRFFIFTADKVEKDILYVIEHHFPEAKLSDVSRHFNQKTRLHHQIIIKKLYSYEDISNPIKQILLKKAEMITFKRFKPQIHYEGTTCLS